MKRAPLILGLILLVSVLLRLPNLNLAPIGLHNAKEIDYLAPARFFLHHGVDLKRHAYVLNADAETAQEEYPQAPLLSATISAAWFFTGESLAVARILMIILSLLGLPALYFLTRKLLNSELAALIAAFFYGVLPVSVFYSRNIQPEMPSLSLGLVACLLTVRLIEAPRKKLEFILTGFLWSLVFILKATIPIIILPWLCLWKRPNSVSIFNVVLFLIAFGLLPALYFIGVTHNQISMWQSGMVDRIYFFRIFTSTYWNESGGRVLSFLQMAVPTLVLVCGMVGAIAMAIQRNAQQRMFLILTFISLVIYLAVVSDYVTRHDYYSLPLIPPLCVCLGFIFDKMREFLAKEKFNRIRFIRIATPLLIAELLILCLASTEMHFNKLFYGLDAIGDILKDKVAEGQKIWIVGDVQSYGFCYQIDRGCAPLPDTSEQLERLSLPWIVVHRPLVGLDSQTQLDFVKKNYKPIARVALVAKDQTSNLAFVLARNDAQNLDITELQNRIYRYKKNDTYLEAKIFAP